MKTDPLGDSLWTKTYGGVGFDNGSMIIETSGNCLVVVGSTDSYGAGAFDLYLIKTDSVGNVLWTKTYGGSGNDFGNCVQETSDGGFIVCGYTGSFGTGADAYLIKTDSLGDTLWTHRYDTTGYSYAYSVIESYDAEFVLTGYTTSYGGDYDIFLLKVNALGDSVWHMIIGGDIRDDARCINQDRDSCYVIIGRTNSFGAGSSDIYLIKTIPDLSINETIGSQCDLEHPYPTALITGKLSLPYGNKCRLFNIAGRVVSPQHITPGVYFVEVDGEIRQKVVKVR